MVCLGACDTEAFLSDVHLRTRGGQSCCFPPGSVCCRGNSLGTTLVMCSIETSYSRLIGNYPVGLF